jgi:MFS family permease
MSKKHIKLSIIALAIISWLISVELTAMNLALPEIAKGIGIPLSSSGWIINVFLITFASVSLVGGRLGDMYGYKRMMLFGVLFFGLGCIVGMAAHTLDELILARVLQGVGGALIWPNSTAIANRIATPERKGFMLGIVTSAVGLGQVCGPIIGGWLCEYSWRYIFGFNIPILAIISLFLVYGLPKFNLEEKQPIAYGQFVLFTLLVIVFIYWLNNYSFLQYNTGLFTAAGVAIAISFMLFFTTLKNSRTALLPKNIFDVRQFRMALFTRVCGMFGFYAYLFLSGMYFQNNLHLSPSHAGLILLSTTLFMAIFSLISGKVLDSRGISLPNYLGYASFFVGFLLSFFASTNIPLLILGGAFIGMGIGFSNAGAIRMALEYMPEKQSATASSIFVSTSLLTGATSVSLLQIAYKAFPQNLSALFAYAMLGSALLAAIWLVSYYLYSVRINKESKANEKACLQPS